jgi:hypothetical protein
MYKREIFCLDQKEIEEKKEGKEKDEKKKFEQVY